MPEAFRTPYPGYDVLAKWDSPSWNDATRHVIGKRLRDIPTRRFFTEAEWHLLEAVCDRLVPQDGRAEPVPIVPWIDRKLADNQSNGFQYVDLPPQRDAWRQGLAAIADESRCRFGCGFMELPAADRDNLLAAIQRGDTLSPSWAPLPPAQFFTIVLLSDVVTTYYSHPAAWSEIGFGGPAAPRGYVRLDAGRADPWEAPPRHG